MVDGASENGEDVSEKPRRLPPLEKDSAWKRLENPTRWGVKDASKKVDDFLYGRRR